LRRGPFAFRWSACPEESFAADRGPGEAEEHLLRASSGRFFQKSERNFGVHFSSIQTLSFANPFVNPFAASFAIPFAAKKIAG
jgi:hypothetical protein